PAPGAVPDAALFHHRALHRPTGPLRAPGKNGGRLPPHSQRRVCRLPRAGAVHDRRGGRSPRKAEAAGGRGGPGGRDGVRRGGGGGRGAGGGGAAGGRPRAGVGPSASANTSTGASTSTGSTQALAKRQVSSRDDAESNDAGEDGV